MKRITTMEMKKIVGGATVAGTLLSSLNALVKGVYYIGQGLGSALVRIIKGKTCACN